MNDGTYSFPNYCSDFDVVSSVILCCESALACDDKLLSIPNMILSKINDCEDDGKPKTILGIGSKNENRDELECLIYKLRCYVNNIYYFYFFQKIAESDLYKLKKICKCIN
jgi:hypothetical protein